MLPTTDLLSTVPAANLAPGDVLIHSGIEQTVQTATLVVQEMVVETNLDTLRLHRFAQIKIVL